MSLLTKCTECFLPRKERIRRALRGKPRVFPEGALIQQKGRPDLPGRVAKWIPHTRCYVIRLRTGSRILVWTQAEVEPWRSICSRSWVATRRDYREEVIRTMSRLTTAAWCTLTAFLLLLCGDATADKYLAERRLNEEKEKYERQLYLEREAFDTQLRYVEETTRWQSYCCDALEGGGD